MDQTARQFGIIADYEKLAEEVERLRRTIAETQETADSADGLVSATVGGNGELIEVWLDPRIYRSPDSAALATTITETIRQAARQAEELVFAEAAKFLPAGATPESTDLRVDPFLHALDRR
ncbi:YbaB/EbfC family nucleoid-associated protein [Actinophytocola sediminis]